MSYKLDGTRFKAWTDAGAPLVGGKLYTYASGTTTPKATYTDSTLGSANTNPIALDARGEADVWLGAGAYTFLLQTAAGVTVDTVDGVLSPTDYTDTLRADLASPAAGKGAALVGEELSGATVQDVLETLAGRYYGVSVFDQVPVAKWASILNNTSTDDHSSYFLAAVNKVRARNGGVVFVCQGQWNVNSSVDCYQGTAKNIRIQGEGRYGTVIQVSGDITAFSHAEYFCVADLTVRQIVTAKTGTAFGTPTTKQAAWCCFERLNIEGFRYGQWWRYSIWNTVKDVRWFQCGVGLKGSRNATPASSGSPTDNNPAAPGAWNADPGFFHNHDRFELCVADGCEAGIWGTFHTSTFDITVQNSSGTGAANTVVPTSVPGVGLWLQNDGNGTSTYGATSNEIGIYSEFVQQPLVLEYADADLSKFFAQGAATSGAAYERMMLVSGGRLNVTGLVRASDYFKYKLVATAGAAIYGDVSSNAATATLGAESLTSSSYYQNLPAGFSTTWAITGAGAQAVQTAVDRNTYEINVVGLYNGVTAVTGKWFVGYWTSGSSRIHADAGNSSDLSLSVVGSTINVNTANPLAYNMRCTVIRHRLLAQAPYTG